MGIFEIILFLVLALIVIPPDDLPQVMRTAGKALRELRLASNTVMREISGAIGDDLPFNLLPPRFDDPLAPAPPASAADSQTNAEHSAEHHPPPSQPEAPEPPGRSVPPAGKP